MAPTTAWPAGRDGLGPGSAGCRRPGRRVLRSPLVSIGSPWSLPGRDRRSSYPPDLGGYHDGKARPTAVQHAHARDPSADAGQRAAAIHGPLDLDDDDVA